MFPLEDFLCDTYTYITLKRVPVRLEQYAHKLRTPQNFRSRITATRGYWSLYRTN